jgi:hypothetical protein
MMNLRNRGYWIKGRNELKAIIQEWVAVSRVSGLEHRSRKAQFQGVHYTSQKAGPATTFSPSMLTGIGTTNYFIVHDSTGCCSNNQVRMEDWMRVPFL